MSSHAGPSSLPILPASPTSSVPPKPSQDTLDGATTVTITPLCAICTSNLSKYTCPRCQMRTCSLSCSTQHKSLGAGCSGVRNKAAYVPMNQYGYMALMDDYTFLEEVGRKVTEAGKEIVQGGYKSSASSRPGMPPSEGGRGGRGRGRARGRGRDGPGFGQGNNAHAKAGNTSKRDLLRMELDLRDIEMDMLPVGMEKRTLNQSTWDSTMNVALMSVEFVFHPPRDPYAPSSQAPDPPVTILTHRHRLDETISQCVQLRIAERAKSKKEKAPPQWLLDLVTPDPSDPSSFHAPACVMPTLLDPLVSLQQSRAVALRPGHIKRHGYYKLDFNDTLHVALKYKQFVEYPTIEVWEKDAFTGTLVDDGGTVVHDDSDDNRRPKRRKLGVKEGKKAITGLLGGYGSDEDSDGGKDELEEKNVLNLLAGYVGSDEEEEGRDTVPKPVPQYWDDDELGDDDAEGETDDELGEEVNPEELAGMLDKLRQAGALRDTSGDGHLAGTMDDEDQVDWGDSDNEG